MTQSLQNLEWMVRIPLTQMEQGIVYMGRIAPGTKRPSDLEKAAAAMARSITHIRRWAEANGVTIKESMHT